MSGTSDGGDDIELYERGSAAPSGPSATEPDHNRHQRHASHSDSGGQRSPAHDDEHAHEDEDDAMPIIPVRESTATRLGKRARLHHKPYLEDDDPNRWRERAWQTLDGCVETLWRLAEVHISRIVLLVLILIANAEHNISLAMFLVVVAACAAQCVSRRLAPAVVLSVACYLAVFAFLRLLYKIDFISSSIEKEIAKISGVHPLKYVCKENASSSEGADWTVNRTLTDWAGFPTDVSVFHLLLGQIAALVVLSAQALVVYRQRHERARRRRSSPSGDNRTNPRDDGGLVFPDFDPARWDTSVRDALKFLIDYGFYKFGVEISLCAMAIMVGSRMDAYSIVLVLWMLVLVQLPRRIVKLLWPWLVLYQAIAVLLHYVIALGLPDALCIAYPWHNWYWDQGIAPDKHRNLIRFLALPDFGVASPNAPNYVFGEFILLMLFTAQMKVFFFTESSRHPAGDNDSIYAKDGHYRFVENNPHHNFIESQRNFVDIFKVGVFVYGHWISLIAVFAAGLSGTSLFAIGYLVIAFVMFWQGNYLYVMRNFPGTLLRWRTLITFTTVVIGIKCVLQLLGCVYLELFVHDVCWVRQLFYIRCSYVLDETQIFDEARNVTSTKFVKDCPVDNTTSAQIVWDVIAFMMLVWQLRILNSLHFQHVMLECRAETVLANRGAVLCNQLIEKEMKEQKRQQGDQLDVIKRRTKEIRDSYAQHQSPFEPSTYGEAKRAGDVYMFLSHPDDQKRLARPTTDTCPEVDPDDARLEPTQVIHAAMAADSLDEAVQNVDRADRIRDDRLRALASVGGLRDGEEDADRSSSSTTMQTALDRRTRSPPGDHDDSEQGIEMRNMAATRRDRADDEEEEEEEGGEGHQPAASSFPVSALRVLSRIVGATLHSAATFLNKRSREYRYVGFVLGKEKEKMKRQLLDELADTTQRVADVRTAWMRDTQLQCVHSEDDVSRLESEAESAWRRRSPLVRFLYALFNCIAAHTDIVCYFLACLAHGYCGGVVTLPLPILVFTWGTLSNPRPSKSFWIVMIAYTQLVIVLHYVFQFEFIQSDANAAAAAGGGGGSLRSDSDKQKAFLWLGLQKRNGATVCDVILLVALFFHRATVRKYGLWKDANVDSTFATATTTDGGAATSTTKTAGLTGRTLEMGEPPRTESTTTTTLPPQDENEETAQRGGGGGNSSTTASTSYTDVTSTPHGGGGAENSEAERDQQQRQPPAAAGLKGPLMRFVLQLFNPKFRYIRDLYPVMFALDVVAFLIITIRYSNFGDGSSGSVVQDISTNRIPLAFVVMLIVLSAMMVVDRALYLRKWVLGKLVYQLLTVLALHVWIFVALPLMNNRPAWRNTTVIVLYLVKCAYLIVSAWQIRNGYPTLSIGNLLTHSYSMFNMVAFQIFMAVPFLFELRTAIDWTWIDTSMPLFDFFNMENFYATIYNLKCARTFEQSYPAPRGVEKGRVVKWGMGVPLIILIILLLWLPLLAFSLLNKLGESLLPDQAQLTIGIDGFPPIYVMQAQGRADLSPVTDSFRTALMNRFQGNFAPDNSKSMTAARGAQAFITEYTAENILTVKFRPASQQFWQISDDSLAALNYTLESLKAKGQNVTMTIRLEMTRPRAAADKEPQVHSREQHFDLAVGDVTSLIEAAMTGNESAVLRRALPIFYQVPNQGEISLARPLVESIKTMKSKDEDNDLDMPFDNITFSTLHFRAIQTDIGQGNQKFRVWFGRMEIDDNVTRQMAGDGFLERVPYPSDEQNATYVQIMVFVDRVFPNFFQQYMSGGVIAAYVTIVIVAGRLIRSLVTKGPLDVMISEIPNPDRLLAIALDIYLVREARDFFLEQDLFAKLIFLFRSPSTLIRWTRPKRD